MTDADAEIAQLMAAIETLEGQRPLLGDAVVEAMLGPAREKLVTLEAQSQPQQQRKQVTILFADVSGFTALSETLDAEVVAGIINDLWAAVDRAITDHGGYIDKHIGDAVMALWGADAAREDDAERAVRAALAMQAAIDAFCTTHNTPLAMRIGINTGPVLLGAVGTMGEFTAMGDAVNFASRLEHAAPVGGVLISHDCYRHVRGVFDVVPQNPISLKGKAEPVQTYVVLRAKPRAFRMATRGVEGLETRMIGREAEMLVLQTAYTDAMDCRETRVVTIIGDAGVGKSRLLYEFDNWIELRPETVWYFKGRATPNLLNVPHSLFRDLFAYRFNILDSDSTAMALNKFRQGMADVLEREQVDIVGHWLGFDFSSSEAVTALLGGGDLGAIGQVYLVRFFRALATEGPLVIFLEDIHWADDASLDLAAYLPAVIPEGHLLIVAMTRPSLFERRPGWGEGEAAFRKVNLSPLSKRASRALVDEILQRVNEVPEELRTLIIDAAEGNPFYIEEMVKMLIDQGVIERGFRNDEREVYATDNSSLTTERWTVRTDKLAALKVPPTLTALLQARLDSLPPPEREALQRASVVGRLFWDDAVADLMQTERTAVSLTLEAIRGRELIFRREHSSFANADEYIFKHALLRDVAYETVLLKNRAEFHGRVARWLESHAVERLGEYMGLIAEHYVLAGEGLRAAAILERSGEEAVEAGLLAVARRVLERALALRQATGETDGPAAARAAINLGRAYMGLGDSLAAEATLERGLAGALAAGEAAAAVVARACLVTVAYRRGQYNRSRTLLETALPAGRAVGGRALSMVLMVAGSWALETGDLATAKAHYREQLELARAMGSLTAEALAQQLLATVAVHRRDLDEAERLYREALALARRANNPFGESGALVDLSYISYRRGDYATAATYARSVLATATELEMNFIRFFALGNLAQANLKLGDIRAARDAAGASLALALRISNDSFIASSVFLFGRILAAEGNVARGLAFMGLARARPALDSLAILQFDEELAKLGLPPDELEAGLAAGAALDFETVVQEILAGKW